MSPPSVSLSTLVRHELRQLLRDGRFRWIGAIVLGLLITSGAFAWWHAQTTHADRAEAQHIAEEQWSSQGEKNPHAAAHYGTWVFKPTGALTFLDPGVEPELGVAVKLQAHKRTALQGAATQDSTAIQHFGLLSPAAILQLILPLLIIGIGFTAWSAERERGTLRQIMSYGVPPSRLLSGKISGLALALTLLLLPAALTATVGLALAPSEHTALPRASIFALSYTLYAALYLLLALWISATARSSRAALVVLLGVWGVTSLITPRLTGDIIDATLPMPTPEAFAADIQHSMKNGLPDGPPRDERVEALLGEILQREGFDGGLMMMQGSLLQGLELEAESAYEREVIDHHFGLLQAQYERQERALQAVSFLSPFIATRSLSMGLAGTNLAHHQHFAQHAEVYRRDLVDQLNHDFATQGGEDGWTYTAGRALWERAPEFTYTPPSLSWTLQRQWPALAALLLWLLVAAIGATRTARRLDVTLR